ncbi:hypothetical protein GCM10027435_18790 [Haloparvum alkalitolerans]|uniref:hypothetical protein n=1 Tax=Haloparvum alkalitolerans TaxID=1042953 RepID=UPI003CE767EB
MSDAGVPRRGDGVRSRLRGLQNWVLLEADRLLVTAALLVGVYLVLDPAAHAVPTGSDGLESGHRVQGLLRSILGGVFLLVSIVVSTSSLFVTQEQGPLGQQLDRIEEVGSLRREIENAAGVTVTPADPTNYLIVLVDAVASKTGELADDVAEADADLQANVEEYLREMAEQTYDLESRLEGRDDTVSLVLATLDYDQVLLTNQLRQLRAEHEEVLPPEADETVDDLLALLRHFAATREYFKTLYFSQEFAALSKHLIYVSLPTILLVSFVLLHTGDFPDTHTATTVVTTVSMAPFMLLSAYVLRVATVTLRTRSTGRFAFERDRPDDVLELDGPDR